MSANSDLLGKLGYRFKDEGLLSRALVHASLAGSADNNERLEFLGDRVLGLAVADMLFQTFGNEDEGSLAKRHTALVQQAALADIAHQWQISSHLKHQDGAATEAVEADAVEALIGAIFIDGGYAAVRGVVENFWRPLVEKYKAPPIDPKSRLQEWVQEKGLPLPVYSVKNREGSDHAPVFDIEVTVKGYPSVIARAASKRAGEKDAAAKFLQQTGIIS